MLCVKLPELLEALDVRYSKNGRLISGACPIHGGDNTGALNIYRRGESVPGYWCCHTRHCENTFKKTIVGFVRGVLSSQKYGWRPDNLTTTVGFAETIAWCCDFLGQSYDSFEVDYGEIEKRSFTNIVDSLTVKKTKPVTGISRQDVVGHLQIPSQYYIDRGYAPETLVKYDVGYYPHKGRPLSSRIAVPVYDNDHKYAMGFTGRSIYPQCRKCGLWHRPATDCPSTHEERQQSCKWKNVRFKKESFLYNYWFAQHRIQQSQSLVLVEGPGEIWRMHEAGIDTGLSLMGSKMSDQQQIILEMSGALTIYVTLNNDEAGRTASQEIAKRLSRSFRVHNLTPSLPANDIGSMSKEDVGQFFRSQL